MQKFYLFLFQEKFVIKKVSNFQKNKIVSFMIKEKEIKLFLFFCVLSVGFFLVLLNVKNCVFLVFKKDKECFLFKECFGYFIEFIKYKEYKVKINKVDFNVFLGKIYGGFLCLEYGIFIKFFFVVLEVVLCILSFVVFLDKVFLEGESLGNFNVGSSVLKRKLRGDFDSDEESLGYNLDSDEEEEILKLLEEIMVLNFNQIFVVIGKFFVFFKGFRFQLLDYIGYVYFGIYINILECLVKEMEDI